MYCTALHYMYRTVLYCTVSTLQALVRRLEKEQDPAVEEDVVLCLLNMVAHETLRGHVADRG